MDQLLARPLDALKRVFTLNVTLQLLAAILGLGGQLLVNRHDVAGFVFWIGANAVLIWLQLRTKMYVLVALYGVYTLFCLEGIRLWTR
jgi:nicotinamide riboside transporter PnuC